MTEHGGYGAALKLTKGEPLVGLAREAELAVYAEVETQGRRAVVVRNAARLQAACDLFWNAVSKSAQDGDLQALDRYIARFGWLASASLRAWAQVKTESQADDGPSAAQVLDSMRGGNEQGE